MKKGFTLIELLAVIVILAIILAIAIPSISNMIENSQINALKSDNKMVLKAVKTYVGVDNTKLPKEIGETTEISLETLQNEGYIESIRSPFNNSKNCNGYILITKIGENNYDYIPHLNCESDIGSSTEDGLIAYWKLDGNAIDYSLNNNHGTIYGDIYSTANRHGTNGHALIFDGVNDYILFPTINTGNDNWTALLWIKTSEISYKPLVSNSSGGPVHNTIGINNSKMAYIYYNGVWNTHEAITNIANNQWHLLVWINYDNETLDYYVDGIYDTTLSPSSISSYSLGPLNIIGCNWSTNYFVGSLSDLRFYSRSLIEAEIKNIYNIEK